MLSRVKAGDGVTAADHNKIVEAVNRISSIKGGRGIRVQNLGGGVTISLSDSDNVWVGIIVDSSEYSDNRYNVVSAYLDTDDTDAEDAKLVWTKYEEGDNGYRQVTATNFAEMVSGTQGLEPDTIVIITESYDLGSPATKRYWFALGGGTSGLTIVITGNGAGGGKYLAKVVDPPTYDIVDTGNLNITDFGVTDASSYVIALNAAELGLSTHSVPANSVWPATLLRRQEDGTLIVSFTGFGFFDCVALP